MCTTLLILYAVVCRGPAARPGSGCFEGFRAAAGQSVGWVWEGFGTARRPGVGIACHFRRGGWPFGPVARTCSTYIHTYLYILYYYHVHVQVGHPTGGLIYVSVEEAPTFSWGIRVITV